MIGQPPALDGGALLNGALRVLERIATGAPLADTLTELCRAIDEQTGLMASVYLLNRAGTELSFAAGPHIPERWREATRAFPALPDVTACGEAVHRRTQVIVPDVLASPLFERTREAARAVGFRSVWSTPFFSKEGQVLGTYAVFSHHPGAPTDTHLELVAKATYLACIAVERHDTDRRLRESEIRFSRAFYLNPACMTIASFATSRFLYVNDAFTRMFGYTRTEAIGRTALELGMYAEPAQRDVVFGLLKENAVAGIDVKGRSKTGQVRDVVLSMERIEILGEECVLAITTDVTERNRAQEALRYNERLLRLVLDAIPVGVAVVDPNGDGILTNPASERIWGGPFINSGKERYARSRGWWHDTARRLEPDEWASTRARLHGETSLNELIDIESFDGVRKVIHNSAVPIHCDDGIVGAVIVNEDVTDRIAAERSLEKSLTQLQVLATRLMHAQDDERRRIAQMLHETTAQDLAALKMMLARIGRTSTGLSDAERALLDEAVDLAEQSMTGIRTLSYLLHPPFLDEKGLLAALRWFVEGFSRRSGITVALDLPAELQRLPRDVETTLFRIVQESLINIHRHAGSLTARVRMAASDTRLTLEVQDHGRGMSQEVIASVVDGSGAFGVGVAGMRERLKRLGGSFEIDSSPGGTTVRALVPLHETVP